MEKITKNTKKHPFKQDVLKFFEKHKLTKDKLLSLFAGEVGEETIRKWFGNKSENPLIKKNEKSTMAWNDWLLLNVLFDHEFHNDLNKRYSEVVTQRNKEILEDEQALKYFANTSIEDLKEKTYLIMARQFFDNIEYSLAKNQANIKIEKETFGKIIYGKYVKFIESDKNVQLKKQLETIDEKKLKEFIISDREKLVKVLNDLGNTKFINFINIMEKTKMKSGIKLIECEDKVIIEIINKKPDFDDLKIIDFKIYKDLFKKFKIFKVSNKNIIIGYTIEEQVNKFKDYLKSEKNKLNGLLKTMGVNEFEDLIATGLEKLKNKTDKEILKKLKQYIKSETRQEGALNKTTKTIDNKTFKEFKKYLKETINKDNDFSNELKNSMGFIELETMDLKTFKSIINREKLSKIDSGRKVALNELAQLDLLNKIESLLGINHSGTLIEFKKLSKIYDPTKKINELYNQIRNLENELNNQQSIILNKSSNINENSLKAIYESAVKLSDIYITESKVSSFIYELLKVYDDFIYLLNEDLFYDYLKRIDKQIENESKKGLNLLYTPDEKLILERLKHYGEEKGRFSKSGEFFGYGDYFDVFEVKRNKYKKELTDDKFEGLPDERNYDNPYPRELF